MSTVFRLPEEPPVGTRQPTNVTDSHERHPMALKARTINVYPNNDPTGHTPGMTCVCSPTSDTQENGWQIVTHQEITTP